MRLTFLGAARMVTGSSYLLEIGKSRVLVDCGMFQGGKAIAALNRRPFAVEPGSIDCVLLTHAHIDHSGLLPKLCKEGFKGPIYSTKVTNELCRIMLPDSAHIQESDAELTTRKGKRSGMAEIQPLYTVDDAFQCLQQFRSVAYAEDLRPVPGLRVRFQEAGHILGSSVLEIWGEENGKTEKLLFTGDLGQPEQPIIRDPAIIETADYIISESTYGNRNHEHYDKESRLAEIVNETVERCGNIIIPAFAVGRTQTLLYHFYKLWKAGRIPEIPVVIDSPLAISATNIFFNNVQDFDEETKALVRGGGKLLELPQLRFVHTADESKALNEDLQPKIIISASGMADAGRILHHLKHNLWRPESSVLFVGYQAQGSVGRRLVDGAKRVRMMGEEIAVKAQIHNLEGFSAHADQEQMMTWLSSFKEKPACIFLVHGEIEMSEPFSERIQSQLGWPVYIPRFADAALLKGREWEIVESDVVVLDPAMRQLDEYLDQMEGDYRAMRRRIAKVVATQPSKANEMLRRLSKISAYFKKMFNDV